jgi:RNA polymerase sigma factor (sigma-70 family)
MLMPDNDLPDLRKVKKGDAIALNAAYQILWGLGEFTCNRRLKGTGIDIGLIVQEATHETLNKLNELDSWDRLKSMMVVVTKNKAVDAVRKFFSGKRGAGAHPLALEDLLNHPSLPKYQRPDNTLITKEALMAINICTDSLPEKKQKVLNLTYEGGLGQRDISKQLNIPQGTVSVLIMRALASLRDCLSKKGYSPK